MCSEKATASCPSTNISLSSGYVISISPYVNSDISNLGHCELVLCGELNADAYARRQSSGSITHLLLLLSSILIVLVMRYLSQLPMVPKCVTHISKGAGQDREGEGDRVVDAIERGIASLRSEALKKLNIIGEWTNSSLSEARHNAEEELTHLITLLNKMVDEQSKSFLNRFDHFCSNAVRKCPDEPHFLTVFGRKNVFLDKVAYWGRSTHQELSEKVAEMKSHASSHKETGGASAQLSNKVKEVQHQLENPNVEVVLSKTFENINMSQREYQTIPKPFYGLSEEPLGQHAVAKVTVETQSVAIHTVSTIHSFSGANAKSPPHVWLNQVRHYATEKSSDNPYLAQLFGYHRSGDRFDLIYHGSLIPLEEQLRKLTNIQPLEKVELISKSQWKLRAACAYLTKLLNLRVYNPTQLYLFLIPMLHYNKGANEMILCGDLTQWHTKNIVQRSKATAKLRLPAMFNGTSIAKADGKDAPTYPHFSRAGDLYGDLPIEELRAAILNFYESVAYVCIRTGDFDIPFFMRGIHVDPRIQKPCNQHWCRPMVDIWNVAAQDFIQLPDPVVWGVPRDNPEFHHPTELVTDNPCYISVLRSHAPHSRYVGKLRIDPAPLGLLPASAIWFSQAGRIFSSPQFQKSGLRKRDIMYIKTPWLYSAFMLDPPSPEEIPVDLSFGLYCCSPHMDMNGIHIGPTKWYTDYRPHRTQLCESSWTLRKCFYCTANGFCWDDDTYEAIDEFHHSLGMDPYSGEMAELMGFPLLDIDDLLHTAGWTCSHPTIQDSMVEHTLTHKDIEVSWDLPIHSPSSMVKDGTSEMNIKMRQYFEEDHQFCEGDLLYLPPPMYAKLIMCWMAILIQFLCKYVLGWAL